MDEGCVIWFTGIPAAGKSTVAGRVERMLREAGLRVENLDSDEIRANISPNLGYTPEARDENTKRLAFFGHLLSRNGVCVIVAAVSNQRMFRDRARGVVDNFAEVWVKCPLEVCQRRDPKGLYARAARGEVNDIAGMHLPYEEPKAPEVILATDRETVDESVAKVLEYLRHAGLMPAEAAADRGTVPR
jgi:adenylylsulfate kinase